MPQAALTSLNEPVLDAPNTALLDTATVAELLACSPRTVTSLIVRGILPAVRLGPGRSAYRIRPAALLEFVSHYGHHEPGDVADFVPTPALLVETRTPEGLRLVTPCWSPDTPQGG